MSSPLAGQAVTVEATVSAVFQGTDELNGFFIQMPDSDRLASHGLFVYSDVRVRPGERIRLRGQVKEFYGLTEITKVRLLDRCGQSRVPDAIRLPTVTSDVQREALEGVRVQVPRLAISQNHQLSRFGQLQIAPHALASPSSERWLVDDPTSSVSPKRVEYLTSVETLDQLHLGSEVASFDAIVSYGFGAYRLIPVQALTTTSVGLSPPEKDEKALRLVGSNVNNLFNGNGRGSGFNDGRGPENQRQYENKRNRLSLALARLDADVIALNEVENDGFDQDSTLMDLIESLNQTVADDRYQVVIFSNRQTGTDAIQNALVFNARAVVPVGQPRSITEVSDWENRWHRPFVLQEFEAIRSGQRFVVVVAHLKSKGSRCPEDTDASVQQEGACMVKRLNAIDRFLDWLPLPEAQPVFLIGDLNAYANERPIRQLAQAGWQSLVGTANAYSYVYDGHPGVLDYIIGNSAAESLVRRSGYWPINSGRVPGASQSPFLTRLPMPKFYGYSDHDPVFVDVLFPSKDADNR